MSVHVMLIHDHQEELMGRMLFQGAVPMGEAGWERARVLAGRPAVDHELTDLYNPLEAGLCSAVSITKVVSPL